jgi:hypothetical protein
LVKENYFDHAGGLRDGEAPTSSVEANPQVAPNVSLATVGEATVGKEAYLQRTKDTEQRTKESPTETPSPKSAVAVATSTSAKKVQREPAPLEEKNKSTRRERGNGAQSRSEGPGGDEALSLRDLLRLAASEPPEGT